MSVDDHGLEAIRKSAVEITPGSKAEYRLRTQPFEGAFQPPAETDAIVVTYPSSTVEVYTFKSGGVSGTTLQTLTVTYTTAIKDLISTVEKT